MLTINECLLADVGTLDAPRAHNVKLAPSVAGVLLAINLSVRMVGHWTGRALRERVLGGNSIGAARLLIGRSRAAWGQVTASEVEGVQVESVRSRHSGRCRRRVRCRVRRNGKHLNEVGHFFGRMKR
jgi:hypothetical protein